MDPFRDAVAAMNTVIRDQLLDALEVSSPAGPWRTVRGAVNPAPAEQSFAGAVSVFAETVEVIELDMVDFAPSSPSYPRPENGWWVRYTDELGAVQVRRLAGPLIASDRGERWLNAPLKAPDPEAAAPA